jgi:hypothetical protein
MNKEQINMTCIDPKEIWPKEAVPNERYKSFAKMLLFTAGDEDQFERARSYRNGKDPDKEVNLEGNIWTERWEGNLWDQYALNGVATNNTFDYIFNKFKKGIFVKILDNKVETFLPFSKHGYINDWGNLMKSNPKFGDMIGFMRYVSDETSKANGKNYKFREENVSRFPNTWYANNCLIRYEHPLSEGDTNVVTLRHMFDELCATREVPDVELFINRRDFPLVTRNGTEPYYNIFGKDKPLDPKTVKKITKQQTESGAIIGGMCPVLSMCTADIYADIVMPTHEDWARVASIEGVKSNDSFKSNSKGEGGLTNVLPRKVTFPPQCKDYSKENFDTPWEKRVPTAVFRGASTGCGVSSDTSRETFNQRLIAAKISHQTKPDRYNVPLIDAGITKWNLRPRKVLNEPYLQTIDFKREAPKVGPLTPHEQSKYKYIINIDGHVSAFRLSLEMSMGCCILLVQSTIPVEKGNGKNGGGWKMWFSHLLKPYVHYVPIKSDLSDLVEKIQWCRDNDEKCKKISEEAMAFSKEMLTRDSILDYMQNLMVQLKTSIAGHSPLGTNANIVYGTDPLVIQNLAQTRHLLSVMVNSPRPEPPSLSYSIPKPEPIYNLISDNNEMKVRGSYGWSKGYSMFLRNMFRPNDKRSISELIAGSPRTSGLNADDEINEWDNEKLLHSSVNLKGVFSKKIFDNKVTTVDLFYIGGYTVVKKSTSDTKGMIEHVNEAFVSDTCINGLLRTIPNFAWSFAFEKTLSDVGKPQFSLLNEYIEGDTLSAATKNYFARGYGTEGSPKPFKNMLEILFQIILSIQYAQERCGFVHNDLAPWNVMVQVLKDPVTIQYPLFSGVYKIATKHVPVIIDYGKSHVVTNAFKDSLKNGETVKDGNVIHYGVVNMFDMIPCQDVFSIIKYTCYDMLINWRQDKENRTGKTGLDVLGEKTTREREESIFKMLNFFSPIKIDTRRDALAFIQKYKNYENLIKASETLDLTRRPVEFIKHCSDIFKKEKVAFGISKVGISGTVAQNTENTGGKDSKIKPVHMDFNNPRQIFDEAFAENINDANKSFVRVPERLYGCTLPQPTTKLELYMVAQSLTKCLKDTLRDYRNFLSNESTRSISTNGIAKFDNAIKFITDFYSKQIDDHGFDQWVIPDMCTGKPETRQMHLSRNFFINGGTYDLKNEEMCVDLSYFKTKILDVINWRDNEGTFEIKGKDRLEIMEQLKKVTSSDWNDKKIAADINTFMVYESI